MAVFSIELSKRSVKFLKAIHPRHAKQLKVKILSLKSEPFPQDAKKLVGYPFHRVDAGEFRIIYKVDDKTVYITLIGKRNDDDVYRRLKRLSDNAQ